LLKEDLDTLLDLGWIVDIRFYPAEVFLQIIGHANMMYSFCAARRALEGGRNWNIKTEQALILMFPSFNNLKYS